jgi:pimeloyl-ACP methyl ester carboxylesterase
MGVGEGEPGEASKRMLKDGDNSFDVTHVAPVQASHLVLFAVGGGGNPERHLPLLTSLAGHGCVVVAPHFERLTASAPTENELLLRARRLKLALDTVACPGLPVAGVGHSIGAAMLLALAGGEVWMRTRQRLEIAADTRLKRLALLAPATAFFQAPRALDAVRTPILAWAGTKDIITPPAQTEFLRHALHGRVPVQVRVIGGADHFSFMNSPPPGMTNPLPDSEIFLADLAGEIARFVTGRAAT